MSLSEIYIIEIVLFGRPLEDAMGVIGLRQVDSMLKIVIFNSINYRYHSTYKKNIYIHKLNSYCETCIYRGNMK